ncbi:MAG: ATP-binding protein, partial [Candidatus Aenigmatarchaeota archaeon]
MKKEEILEILMDWNFWKKDMDTGILRKKYLEKVKRFLKTNMVIALIGVRRAGKSFLMMQIAKNLIEEGIDPREILIVNFEDRRFTDFSIELLDEIFETYLEFIKPKSKPYIFLDEVHKVENWERWVRTFQELRKCKIIISGSTSKLLKSSLASLLTGRHLDLIIFPLDFKEFLSFKNLEIKDKLDLINKKIEIKSLVREYCEFGGFPEVVLSTSKKEILLNYFEDIITKDIVLRYRIKKVRELISLARFYLTNISNPITYTSLEDSLKITADTIEKFSSYMEESFLIFFVSRFSKKVKEVEKSPRKVYCTDIGLANAIGLRFSENIGKIIENLVAVELKKQSFINPLVEIFYFKDYQQNEVDFVLKEGLKIKQLIQVTYASGKDEIEKREIKALIKASEELKCKNLLVITWDYEDEIKVKNKRIVFKPLWKWLLEEK